MFRLLLLISFLSITSFLSAQYIDTTGAKIIIRENESSKALFTIDWEKVYFQNSKINVKEKLGSYNVTFKKGNPLEGFKIINLNKKYVLWKNGASAIQLLIKDIGNKKIEVIISSNELPNHWHIPFKRNLNEKIYGGGIQFSKYGDLNKTIINLSQENGIGRGGGSINKWTSLAGVNGESYATYCPLPKFATNSDRSFSWNDYCYSKVEFSKDYITFDIFESSISFILGYDTTNNELKGFNQPLPYKLPSWSLGTIIGAQGGTQKALEKLSSLTDAGVKVNALWIQDWVGKQPTKFGSRLKWNWQLDQKHYCQFDSLRSILKQKDIKLLGYVNPFFALGGPYEEKGISKGYFIKENTIAKKFEFGGIKGYMIDLFNEDAYNWMKKIIKTNLVDKGFSGWMADFAEWFPIDNDQEFILENIKQHNEYPVLWAKLNYEIIIENDNKEILYFNRSGGKGTEQYSSMMWAGDQMVDASIEDGLGSVFDAYLSSSYSGLPILHSDVGGYTSIKKPFIKNYLRNEKLLKDWMLLEAFTPVFRTHEGLLPEDNIQVYSDSSIIHIFKKFSDINHALLPYFEELIEQKNKNGTPIFKEIEHNIKDFKTDNPGFCVGNQIMIIHQIQKDDYTPLINFGWKFVNNCGALKLKPSEDNRIIVAVKNIKFIVK